MQRGVPDLSRLTKSFFLFGALASALWNLCTQSTSVHPRATEPMMTNTYDNMISSMF